ncbi:MAG TPA: M14 metallopeptidase family protein [Aridibacter sp.]|nr:M14 metallopeptidase family protein [Aridibacter sp.]
MLRHSKKSSGAIAPSGNRGAVRVLTVLLVTLFLSAAAFGQEVPSPRSVLGFQPTDDRTIADWKQITDYFAKLDAASGRVKVQEIGKTTLGKSQIVAIVSSEQNIRNLEQHRQINASIANPGSDRLFHKNAKAVVAISCSIHSTEIVASQMSMLMAHELASAQDAATKQILDNVILLLIPSANPDGIDIVAEWYRKTLGTKYEGTSPPELYHHYAGHDNNRDWFMMNLAETRNITKLFWQEWFPQIVWDVHQQGQTAARMTVPPFFDPPNPRIDPRILRELGLLGYKMAADLQATGQAGIVTNATYDTWWHGGFRSAPYYHNSIGILTEAASAELMSPVTITKQQLEKQGPTRGFRNPLETATNAPDAWTGGEWSPKDIARIELVAGRAVLEMAAKFRQRYIDNMYELAKKNLKPDPNEPEAFVIYAGQPREETVSRFLEILMWQGMEVRLLTEEIEGATDPNERDEIHEIPGGSFIVLVNQPQKPNVLSLFEQQVYPNRLNASGEAEVPYDVAGWTLPLQMGVEYAPVFNILKDPLDLPRKTEIVTDINQARRTLNLSPVPAPFSKMPNPLKNPAAVGLYKGWTGSMDEGWTRLVLDNHGIKYRTLIDKDVRDGDFGSDILILPSMGENSIVRGNREERYPKEYTGGIGKEGVENLKKFVSEGGRLVCFDSSCDLVIKAFGLPLKNTVEGLNRGQFYCPGSILALDVETSDPIARGLKERTAAYFTRSSAWEIGDGADVRSVARYAEDDLLLSGWILGEQHIKGKTAIAAAKHGKGEIVLFAFRPQHRGQSFATFPFIFNTLEKQAAPAE